MASLSKRPSILLIVGGGIAAYKSLELIRLLRAAEMQVRVVLTKAGAQFVTPLSLASLSGNKVYEDLFSLTDETEMGHIELSRQADLVVMRPPQRTFWPRLRWVWQMISPLHFCLLLIKWFLPRQQ